MMNIEKPLRWMCMGLLSVGLAACVGSKATIQSNKAPDYHPQIKRLLLVTDLGLTPINRPDGDEEANFEAAVTESLSQCGITVQFRRHDALDLQNGDQRAIQTFAPDTLLTLAPKATGAGRKIYAGTIIDMAAKKPVWRSELDIQFAWFAGKTLAGSLIGRLKEDGILASSCPTPTRPPGI
jgi:hypothetical protein